MYPMSKHKNVAKLGSKIASSPKPTDAEARYRMPLLSPTNGRPDSALHLPPVNSPLPLSRKQAAIYTVRYCSRTSAYGNAFQHHKFIRDDWTNDSQGWGFLGG